MKVKEKNRFLRYSIGVTSVFVTVIMLLVVFKAVAASTVNLGVNGLAITYNGTASVSGVSSSGFTASITGRAREGNSCSAQYTDTFTFTNNTGEKVAISFDYSVNFPSNRASTRGSVKVNGTSYSSNGSGTVNTKLAANESLTIVMQSDRSNVTTTVAVSNLKFDIIPTYTVTWKNGDTVLKTDTVEDGTAPAYSGNVPEKAEDEDYTYTFSGWTDGTTTYGATDTLPAVTGDITYTATYTAKPKDLFPQHSVSLGGNIGVNFYIDPAAADADEHAAVSVDFSWNGQTSTVAAVYDPDKKLFKATCDVVAAEVACDITAVATVNGAEQAQTDTYSVQDYAEAVYNNPAAYDNKGKPDELKALAKALLNYGAMAQTVFEEYMTQPVKAPATIVSTVGDNGYEGVTADQIEGAINGEASDLKKVAEQLGFKYYTSSVLYLSKNTLRLYFTPNNYQDAMPHEGDFKDKKSNYYYYVEKENIAAAELDNQQTFTIDGTDFTFSALDYAKAVVNSGKMEPEQKNLAKALYLYNKAANAYFDAAPAPVQKIVDLSTVTEDTVVENGYTITGTLQGDCKISIADGATVTLKGANITCLTGDAEYAGITPLGDATILLEGENTVKGGYENYPGIFVPENTTLTIDGTGSLNASSNGYGCGIGGGYDIEAGNIVINGGTITATGGEWAAGIGSGNSVSGGNITITGGTITANGGGDAAGIGSGSDATCGNILITGGTVTASGRYSAAGIGSGYKATCGNITIADTVTQVTATKGNFSPNSIGAGEEGSCGTVTIGGVEGAISTSPYTYEP